MSPWTRRAFLEAGAAGTAGLALDNQIPLLAPAEKLWNAGSGRNLRKFRDPLRTVCRVCPAHCGVVVFRDGDRIVQLLGSSGSPTNQGGLCARAYTGLERVYDGDRVLRPLRRTGPRGSGRWEATTWEAALAELGARLRRGARRRVLHVGQEEPLVEELRGALGWQELLVDEPSPGRPGPMAGEDLYGAPVLPPDIARSKTVFLFGARALDGRLSLPLAKALAAAGRAGTAVHLFDSFEGVTGGIFCWERVAPEGEAWAAFGIARLLLEWKRFDAAKVSAHCADSPERLRAALSGYTPDAVAKATGIAEVRLLSLARAFAEGQPAVAVAPLDSKAAVGAALLNHLTGAINAPGGVPTARGPFFVAPLRPTRAPEAWLRELADGSTEADLYWVSNANPVYDSPRSGEVARALADSSRVGFLAVMDTHLTETAQLADLFLPLATSFESWGILEGTLSDGRSYLFLQQPSTGSASEPVKLRDPATEHLSLFEPLSRALGEARSLSDVLLHLARGRSSELSRFADTKAYLQEILMRSWGPGSLDALQQRGVWVSEDLPEPNRGQRISLVPMIPPTPDARPPGQLYLVGRAPSALPRGYSNSRWGMEIEHRSEGYLHRETGRRLGLRSGDRICIQTEGGEAEVAVRLIEGIHPEALSLPDGLGHRAGGSAAVARSSIPSSLPLPAAQPGDPIWWEREGPGVSLRALFPFRVGPRGLQDWGPIPVDVRKA